MCSQNHLILGIETSCDETAAAVVSSEGEILSNIVYSQIKEHEEYGGVIPEFAARSHLVYLPGVVEKAIKDAGITKNEITAIAATAGPGLIGGLHVGVSFGKSMAHTLGIPFIPVNHLEGHALTARLTEKTQYPFLLLLISGGHCQIIDVEAFQKYKMLGSTIDDSAGELFDKTARLMDLPYPGGPKIEELAKNGNPDAIDLPRPLYKKKHCNFSFSGLKTAVRLAFDQDPNINRADLAASLQKTVSEVLVDRLQQAIKICKRNTLIVAGGVASNKYIRKNLEEFCTANNMTFHAPPIKLCTDNAAMIAWVGAEHLIHGVEIKDLETRPRWPLEEIA